MLSNRPIVRRALAAAATLAAGAALLGVLGSAGAEQSQKAPNQAPNANKPSAAVTLDEPNAPNPPPPAPEAPKPKPSPARKYLPVKHFGGY